MCYNQMNCYRNSECSIRLKKKTVEHQAIFTAKEFYKMSQEKVDRYKEHKKNRQKEMKKAKQRAMAAKIIGALAAIAIVIWLGYSGYSVYQNNVGIETVTINTSGITEYLSGL